MRQVSSPWGLLPDGWKLSTIKKEMIVVTDYVANGSFASLAENVQYSNTEEYAILIRLYDYNNNFSGNFVYVNEHAYNFLSKSKLYGDEIIISNVGANVGTVFKCPRLSKPMTLGPNSIVVKLNGNNDFYFYWFKSRYGKYCLDSIVSGSAQPKFNKTHFKEMPIPVPPLVEQEKIASILSALDNKIAVNRRICANLEAQAQALFKSWFVDFTPFKDQPFVDSELGPIPQGWKVGKLGDYVEIKRGGSPRPIQKFLTSQGLNWLKISDATSTQSPFIFNIKEKIIINGLKKTVFLKAGSLVLSNSATPCIPKFLSIDSCIHDGWLYFPHSQLPKNYLYLFFKLMRNNLVSKANGSVFLNLKTDIVKNQVFAFSGEEIYNSFDKIIAPLFKEIENLTYETFQLSALRDTLLPKLMSGEIKL